MAGGRIDIEVGADVRSFPAQLETGLRGAMGVATKIGSALGLAVGAGAAAKAVLDIGNSFTNELNTLQAVSGATADQLTKVREAAMGLGNDASLADASATDAAAAMTELAKGGFTVEQSMAAARGTLELAAAAQIGAAEAATIQSKALQAFGLDADYAATAADVLANGANASSAEITEIAMGLQQAGAVANQFGVSLEDTVAGLGLLANAGIAGSDAGTLLKSSLLALTDQGKPAQQAIEDLGLSIYDAQGQFVGFRSLFEQLQEASANMTPEMYQAATATLFGSDAMRLAGVAAEQGVTGWDAMRDAVDREGAAADVAAAKMQGLPGAMSAAQNAAEGLSLEVYDLVDGPLESMISKGAELLTDFTPAVVSGLTAVADAIEPVIGFAGDLAGAFADLPAPVQAAVAAFAGIKAFGIDDTFVSWIEQAREAFAGFGDEMELQQSLAAASASEYDGLGEAINENAEPLSEWAAGLAAVEARVPAVRQMGDAYRNVSGRAREIADRQREAATESGRMVGALRNAGAAAVTFGGQVGGVAAAGARGLGTAAMGAVNALGGPWMVGIMAAGMAVSELVSEVGNASRQQDILETSSRSVAEAQRDMAKAFQDSKGAISDNVLSAIGVQIEQVRSEAEQLADTAPGWTAGIVEKWNDMLGSFSGEEGRGRAALQGMRDMSEQGQNVRDSFNELGATSEQLAQQVSGSDAEFAALVEALRATSNGGEDAVAKVMALRKGIQDTQEGARLATPGFFDVADAMKVLADASASAEDKASALKRTLDVLAGVPVPLSDAIAEYNERVRETAEETTNAWAAAEGFGAALLNADGSVNTASANGGKLYDTLKDIRDATADAAAAGADMGPIWAQNEEQFRQLAAATGLSVDQIRAAAEAVGLNPDVIMSLRIDGGDQAIQELNTVSVMMQAIEGDGPKTVSVKVEDEAAKTNLRELGFEIEELPGGFIEVTAPNDLALAALQQVIDKTIETGSQSATPEIDADTTGFVLKNEDVLAKLREIDTSEVDPAIGAVIDDFIAGRDVTLAELAKIDTSKASTEVRMLIEEAMRQAQVVSAAIDQAARNRTATIRVVDQWDPGAREAYFGDRTVQGPFLPRNATGGRLHAFAGGGRMPTTGPGTETTDGIFAVDPNGVPIAKVDGGEWVVNSAMSERYDRELAMMNAGTFPKLPGFETGGRIVESMRSAVQSRFPGMELTSGLRFTDNGYHSKGMAADFSDGFDSTPTMRALAAWIADNYADITLQLIHQPFDRNIGQGQGFVGDGTGFYGVGTMAEHRNHVHWAVSEPVGDPSPAGSSPSGTDSGASPRGSRSRNRQTWDEQDELKLDSARIAVQQAIEARDKAMNDPKKSQADKDQAENKVAKAEQKVKDLEAEKYAAETGDTGPAPQAPDLTTNRSDDEIRMRELERSIAEANERRNEVYADPKSTQRDRDAADDALQKAKNALTDAQNTSTEGSKSDKGVLTASGISDLLGNVAKAAVQGQVESAFGVLGFKGEGALSQAIVQGVNYAEKNREQLQVAPQFSDEEIAKQGPVTPGTPGWLEKLIDSLKVPAVLRDSGGPLPHGMAALNLSGEEEWVLTGQQRRDYERDMAALRAGTGTGSAVAQLDSVAAQLQQLIDNPPVQHNSTFNGYDLQEAFRRDRVAKQQAAVSFRRR
ncbi:phage tail tape measure protein [Rhodococcus aetherivorans]|uniref:phage tail tape measure protein n=1 Tax=Rhodococcus aetherivorans TaxID=191292 RepID=UPI0002D23AE5|nr:phage tail tape measure protein [Rhodococcus aetherivorans]CCW14600.1 putative phage tail [Rhodococcus aetherivorans]